MTMPLMRPKRKNPVLRTRQMNLPPWARGRVALGITAAAAEGRFELQECQECGTVQYPPREACHKCLSASLRWREQPGEGNLLATTTLYHSNDMYFRERLPWRLGLVHLDAGPTLMVHMHGEVGEAPARVRVGARLDRAGQAVLIGFPNEGSAHMADDKMLREMTSDPKFRKVLVTDGKTEVGQAIVRALVKAGADIVWVGHAEPWKKLGGLEDITALPQVTLVPLDLTNGRSVTELAGEIGGQGRYRDQQRRGAPHLRHHGAARHRCGQGRDGHQLLRPAAPGAGVRTGIEGPLGRRRDRRDRMGQPAVGLCAQQLPIARHVQRVEGSGAFTGAVPSRRDAPGRHPRASSTCSPDPIDDEWNQHVPPPKLAGSALANAIVKALRDGVEDVYPGDVAQEWLERWRDNPKVLERELAAGGS